MKFFAYLSETLSDPNDQQGSTKRLCLFLFVLLIIALLAGVTIHDGKLPMIPDSVLNLIYFIIGSFLAGVTADKGIAAYKSINTPPAT